MTLRSFLKNPNPFAHFAVDADTDTLAIPISHVYPDLSDGKVQETLGLSDAQRQRVREILGRSATLTERLEEEARRLSPDERKKLRVEASERTGTYTTIYGGVIADAPTTDEEKRKQEEFEDTLRKERENAAGEV